MYYVKYSYNKKTLKGCVMGSKRVEAFLIIVFVSAVCFAPLVLSKNSSNRNVNVLFSKQFRGR